MSKDELLAANYRPKSGEDACGNCAHFDRERRQVNLGYCRMFGVIVKQNYVCDKYLANAQRRQAL